MGQDEEKRPDVPNEAEVAALAREFVARHAFGPAFFLGQLAAFVRDHCPSPEERLPVVELHLQGGDVVEICHVIGVAPCWVAVAAREREDSERMATVLIPYELIVRVEIRSAGGEERRLGFSQERRPAILAGPSPTPEDVLRSAAVPAPVRSS